MRFELTTTDLEGRGTTSCAAEMSKMIPNLPIFHWRRTLPRSKLTEQTGTVTQLVVPRLSRSVVVSSNLIHARIERIYFSKYCYKEILHQI